MAGILSGLCITECGAFIAGPFATLSLAKLGAEVIRIDPIEGGVDHRRWPVTKVGHSLYWAGLNKGKKSIAIDLHTLEGQELAQAIITASGPDRGIFVSNFPATGWLDVRNLRARRNDLIAITITGNYDGSTAVDYTTNCSVGFPLITGPEGYDEPINHVLPAWDFICGQTVATALLAAERHRTRTGEGEHVRIALSDVALAVVTDMGFVSEVEINRTSRPRNGNFIYGAFGRDFKTADGRRVMVAAISLGQWTALCRATDTIGAMAVIERRDGADLRKDSDRFAASKAIAAVLEPWFASRRLEEVRSIFDAHRVCWNVYQSFDELVTEDPRCSTVNPLFESIDHPGIGATLTARSPIAYSEIEPVSALTGPWLGQHTDEVLQDVLKLDSGAIAALHDRHIIASGRVAA